MPAITKLKRSTRIGGWTLVLMFCLGLSNSARADLYTGNLLSLEYSVDASDFIVEVTIPEDQHPTEVDAVRVLKIESADSESRTAEKRNDDIRAAANEWLAERTKHATQWEPTDTHWLLFGRWRDHPVEHPGSQEGVFLFHTVNLSRPFRSASTAAVTIDGTILPDRKTILDATTKRTELRRSLPNGAAWDVLEALTLQRGLDKITKLPKYEIPPQGHIGGVRLPIDVDYWDERGPYDEDTIYLSILAPVEPNQQWPLLRLAAGTEHTARQLHLRDLAINDLVNYPGEKTDTLLLELSNKQPHGNMRARAVYDDLHRFDDLTDERNQSLVGHWRLVGKTLSIDLNFRDDQSCAIDVRKIDDLAAEPIRGEGYWYVKDDCLTIVRERFANERFGTFESRRVFLPQQPIVSVTTEKVELARRLSIISISN